jgi:hypothetical protein
MEFYPKFHLHVLTGRLRTKGEVADAMMQTIRDRPHLRGQYPPRYYGPLVDAYFRNHRAALVQRFGLGGRIAAAHAGRWDHANTQYTADPLAGRAIAVAMTLADAIDAAIVVAIAADLACRIAIAPPGRAIAPAPANNQPVYQPAIDPALAQGNNQPVVNPAIDPALESALARVNNQPVGYPVVAQAYNQTVGYPVVALANNQHVDHPAVARAYNQPVGHPADGPAYN